MTPDRGNRRIFLLSPASSSGKRAALLFNDQADFDIASRVRTGEGAPLGEVFSFLSGLYFRGKLKPMGSYSPGTMVTLKDLERFATVQSTPTSHGTAARSSATPRKLAERIGPRCEVVLLGSVATGKYVDVLLPIFGDDCSFQKEFLGHGDMARGGMLLQRAASGVELTYIPVSDPSRLGIRPTKKARAEFDARP